jgi:TPR repeat protein
VNVTDVVTSISREGSVKARLLLSLVAMGLVAVSARSFDRERASAADPVKQAYPNLDVLYTLIERDLQTATAGRDHWDMRYELERLEKTYLERARANEQDAQFKLGALYAGDILYSISPRDLTPGHVTPSGARAARRWFATAGGFDHPLTRLFEGHHCLLSRNPQNERGNGVAGVVIETLGKIGPGARAAIPELEAHLLRDDPLAGESSDALGEMGEQGLTVLLGAVRSDVGAVRRLAIYGLERAARTSTSVKAVLVDAADDGDDSVSNAARSALRYLDQFQELRMTEQPPQPTVQELIAALDDESPKARAGAALRLGSMYHRARAAVPSLTRLLEDENKIVRDQAARSLLFIWPEDRDAVTHLLELVKNNNASEQAIRALGNDWPGVDRAIPGLVEVVGTNYSNPSIRIAGESLKRIAGRGHTPAVIAGLVEWLNQDKVQNRSAHVIDLLGDFGVEAKSAIPPLRRIMNEDRSSVRMNAATALGKIDETPDEAVAMLVNELRFGNEAEAAAAIGELGPRAVAAVATLLTLLESRESRAFDAFKDAAERGLSDAQFELAKLYRDGVGTTVDDAAARRWLKRAARHGHSEAQRHLGILYRQGRGVKQSDRIAEVWYRKAVERDSALLRLKQVDFSDRAYEKAIRPHQAGSSKHRPQATLSLAITTFIGDARHPRYIHVRHDGTADRMDQLPTFASRERRFGNPYPYQLANVDQKRLERLMNALPPSVNFAPITQRLILSCSVDGAWITRTYDVEALPAVICNVLDLIGSPSDKLPYPPQEFRSLHCDAKAPLRLVYLHDGTLAAFGQNARIDRWKDGKPLESHDAWRYPLPGAPIALSPDGTRMVSGKSNPTDLWDCRTGRRLAHFDDDPGMDSDNDRALFSGDGRVLVPLRGPTQDVGIWDARSGERRSTIRLDRYWSMGASICRDGKLLAMYLGKSGVQVWDLERGSMTHQFPEQLMMNVAISPDGKVLAACDDNDLIVWDLETGATRFKTSLSYQQGSIVFTPDGSLLVSRHQGRNLRIWDARSGEILAIAQGHVRGIDSLAISPDGKEIASISTDGVIKLWSVARLLRAGRGQN